MLGLGGGGGGGEGVEPNPNIVRIVNTIDIYGPFLKPLLFNVQYCAFRGLRLRWPNGSTALVQVLRICHFTYCLTTLLESSLNNLDPNLAHNTLFTLTSTRKSWLQKLKKTLSKSRYECSIWFTNATPKFEELSDYFTVFTFTCKR